MKLCGGAGKSTRQKYISRLLWLTSTARNALVVVGCSLIAYYCETSGIGSPFLLTGSVKQGMPTIQLPPFQTVVANRTVLFGEMLCDLGTSVVLVPVIAVLGNVAIAKAFGKIILILYMITMMYKVSVDIFSERTSYRRNTRTVHTITL